jgi:rhodanese-related sulfurtransferase
MEDKDAILIDIRTPEELKETGVLSSNVINIDFYSEDYENTLQALDKNATYLIYCRSGNRSGQTLEIMKRL